MSLAMNAAPFDNVDHEVSISSSQPQSGQRRRNNKTVKLRGGANKISSENVNSVIANIHGGENHESGGEMGDFVPISPPVSVGVEQTKIRHDVEESSSDNSYAEYDPSNIPDKNMPENPLSSNGVDYDKYRQYMPDYKKMYGTSVDVDDLVGGDGMPKGLYAGVPTGQNQQHAYGPGMRDPLIEKLNHVIHLLEEQQDDKTSHATEEIVLYFFLGIFMIFIIDSFTRLGKYTR